jgi:DMSO reductase anchor subunit
MWGGGLTFMWHSTYVAQYMCGTVHAWHSTYVAQYMCGTVHMWHSTYVAQYICFLNQSENFLNRSPTFYFLMIFLLCCLLLCHQSVVQGIQLTAEPAQRIKKPAASSTVA